MNTKTSQNKQRVIAYLPPKVIKNMEVLSDLNNMKNNSEFIYNAVDFYIGYLSSQNSTAFLSEVIMGAVRGELQLSERRHSGNLFRLSVEMSMMMNLIAAGLEIEDDQLSKLRGRCVREIKKSKGKIAFEDAVEYQRSDD